MAARSATNKSSPSGFELGAAALIPTDFKKALTTGTAKPEHLAAAAHGGGATQDGDLIERLDQLGAAAVTYFRNGSYREALEASKARYDLASRHFDETTRICSEAFLDQLYLAVIIFFKSENYDRAQRMVQAYQATALQCVERVSGDKNWLLDHARSWFLGISLLENSALTHDAGLCYLELVAGVHGRTSPKNDAARKFVNGIRNSQRAEPSGSVYFANFGGLSKEIGEELAFINAHAMEFGMPGKTVQALPPHYEKGFSEALENLGEPIPLIGTSRGHVFLQVTARQGQSPRLANQAQAIIYELEVVSTGFLDDDRPSDIRVRPVSGRWVPGQVAQMGRELSHFLVTAGDIIQIDDKLYLLRLRGDNFAENLPTDASWREYQTARANFMARLNNSNTAEAFYAALTSNVSLGFVLDALVALEIAEAQNYIRKLLLFISATDYSAEEVITMTAILLHYFREQPQAYTSDIDESIMTFATTGKFPSLRSSLRGLNPCIEKICSINDEAPPTTGLSVIVTEPLDPALERESHPHESRSSFIDRVMRDDFYMLPADPESGRHTHRLLVDAEEVEVCLINQGMVLHIQKRAGDKPEIFILLRRSEN